MRFGLHDGYWGAISAIIVLQSNFGSTITASRDRLLGTLIGALFGFSFSLFGTLPWNYILAVFRGSDCLWPAWIPQQLTAGRGHHHDRHAGAEGTLALDARAGSRGPGCAGHRGGSCWYPRLCFLTVRGCGCAMGWPRNSWCWAHFLRRYCKAFAACRLRIWRPCARDALAILRGNNQLLEAARNEPSGGPGWREGLGMLAQFGRSIFDALVALEFAVRDSHEDGYAQQLDRNWASWPWTFAAGFHYLAGCIHDWRFHVPPQGINLEEDIAQLEARMAAVRHTGIAIFAG